MMEPPEVAVYPLLSGGVELTLRVYRKGVNESVAISTNLSSSEIALLLRRVADVLDPEVE